VRWGISKLSEKVSSVSVCEALQYVMPVSEETTGLPYSKEKAVGFCQKKMAVPASSSDKNMLFLTLG